MNDLQERLGSSCRPPMNWGEGLIGSGGARGKHKILKSSDPCDPEVILKSLRASPIKVLALMSSMSVPCRTVR